MITNTNTSLATARRCLREYELRYELQLELDYEDREPLQVGQAWHRAFHAQQTGRDPYAEIDARAPSPLWIEKLRRLFAAYAWHWKDQPLEFDASEHTFRTEIAGSEFEGQLDGIVWMDGRRGIIERKTTSDGLDSESAYWDRLRLDVQTGIYSSAIDFRPDFILYDVVRKPTINPKRLTKAECSRMTKELVTSGSAAYFGEHFDVHQLHDLLIVGRESVELYGARLTADIGDRPDFYFARRPVDRTAGDYAALHDDLRMQVDIIERARDTDSFPRNPDSCAAFGRCAFFGICSNNVHPQVGESPPFGFRRREHRHPELAQPEA